MAGLKKRMLDADTVEGDDRASFEDALNEYLSEDSEKDVYQVFYQVDGGKHYALILYVE